VFGVLVVRDSVGNLGCLYGFSGAINGDWHYNGFVPPAFDEAERTTFLPAAEERLRGLKADIDALTQDEAFIAAKEELAQTAQTLEAQTQALQSELVERKAQRRIARESASAEELEELQRVGEADARRRKHDRKQAKEILDGLRKSMRCKPSTSNSTTKLTLRN